MSFVKLFFHYSDAMRSDKLREAVCSEVVRILHDERKKKKLSMTRLAEQSGLSQAMISFVERDLRNPTLDTLLRVADALELELSDVLVRAKRAASRQTVQRQTVANPSP
jgi:transcriptional regulator with XRE-family HTH domain